MFLETRLLPVAIHEIGHALGLAHSSARDSLIRPAYQPERDDSLGIDDIQGIQALYGKYLKSVYRSLSLHNRL